MQLLAAEKGMVLSNDDLSTNTFPCAAAAPPLTLDNVFEAVKRVRDWRGLGGPLLGYAKAKANYKLDAIQRQFDSNEARLKAMLESFLLGEGLSEPTWRGVIHALHKADEIAVARDILSYAEAVEGEYR